MLGKQVPILSIDPFERVQPDSLNPQGIYSAYLENIRKHNVESSCLPLAAFSQDAAPVVPDKIGVLVVDGGHHYPVVNKDLALYGPKLLDGGFIFIDDYGTSYPDVVRAVDEYFVAGSQFTILHKAYFIVAQRGTGVRPLSAPTSRENRLQKETAIEGHDMHKRSSTG
jgi:Methyltransferase domain